MRIFKWKSLVGLRLVGVCSESAVRALADDGGKDKPSVSPAGVKIDSPSSGLNRTASANADSTGSGAAPSGKGADSLEAVAAKRESSADERKVSDAEQSAATSESTNQEPMRRALPAPLDG